MMAAYNEGVLNASKPEKCGCQELLNKISLVHYGWLRRKCLRNALQIKYIKWPQQYVIVGQKCLYYFNSETSKQSEGAISLYGFNRIVRASNVKTAEALWAFKLEHIQPHIRSIYFGASSEREMVTWMKAIKAEMLNANNLKHEFQERKPTLETVSISSWDSGDYKDLEDSIYMEPEGSRETKYFDDSDEVSESENNEDFERPPVPPRPACFISSVDGRRSSSSFGGSLPNDMAPNDIKPPSQEVQKSEQHGLSGSIKTSSDSQTYWESIYFRGGKNESSEVIKKIAADGVYLVRKGSDNLKVMLLYVHPVVKKFKILEKVNGQVSLQCSGPDFETIEELLFYYYSNNLPNMQMKLVTPYKLHSSYQ